jgi:MFS family permease
MHTSRRGSPHLIFGALAVAACTYAVSQTMLIPSLPDIEAALDSTPSGVTALMTSFWVAGAVTVGIFGRLGDMFGKRRALVVVMLMFSAGAAVCAVAPTLPLMIVGRVLMGCGVGIFPLAFSLIRDELPPRRVVGAIAQIGGMIALGAAVGQSTGGLISDHLGYQAIFWVSVATGLVSVAGLLVFVPESPVRTGGRVDIVGALLLAVGLAAPLVAIAETPSWGWGGTRTLFLFAVGAVLLTTFARYEQRGRDPLLDIPTMLLPRVRMTNAATFFVGVGLYGVSTIMTQFFQEPASTGYAPGANATTAGLYVVPGLLLLMVTSPLAGRLSSRVGPAFTLRLGIVISTTGVAGMAFAHTETFEMYLWPGLMYVGLGATFGAMPTIILQAVPPELSGQSAAINMIVRTVGSALGVQLAATIVTASVGAGGNPTDRGYTTAFLVEAGAGVVALLFALAIPRQRPAAELRTPAAAFAEAPAVPSPGP